MPKQCRTVISDGSIVTRAERGTGRGMNWLMLWDSGTPVERRASSTYQRIQINSLYLQPRCPTFNRGWCVCGGRQSEHLGMRFEDTTTDDCVMGSKSSVMCTNQSANHACLTHFEISEFFRNLHD